MSNRHTLAHLLGLCALACGGSVDSGSSTGGAGATTSGVGGTSSGGSGNGGAGAITGGGGGSSGGAGTPSCIRFESSFGAKFSSGDSEQPPVCGTDEWATKTFEATGIVIASAPNMMQIDRCSPAADCVPLLLDALWDEQDLNLVVPVGAIVRLEYSVSKTWYDCSQSLFITNVPSWDGVPNPISSDSSPYLLAGDGTLATPQTGSITIEPLGLGCPSRNPGRCGGSTYPADDYALVFVTPTGDATLQMGQSSAIGGGLVAKNLRSYVTGYCDDYWNWGYWIARQ